MSTDAGGRARRAAGRFASLWLLLVGCASFDAGGHTGRERDLIALAAEIRTLARADAPDDARVGRLREEAAAIWAESPSNTKRSAHGPGSSGYEFGIIRFALVDYYRSTGRVGLAIPVFEEAAEEALRLRYYAAWQDIGLQLVTLYQRVGMLDHARERIDEQLEFLARLGFDEDNLPPAASRDAVVFVSAHATRLTLAPEVYDDPNRLRALFNLYRVSVDQVPEAWGWTPSDGFRFVTLTVPFAHRFVELGDVEAVRRVREEAAELHRRNRSLDPFAIVNQKQLDSWQSQLGRDLHALLNRPFSALVAPLTETVRTLPPRDRRYLALDVFVENFERAQLSARIGEFDEALAAADRALESHRHIVEFYAQLPPEYATQDRIDFDRRWLELERAGTLEALGRYEEAERPYEEYVVWSERERTSLPVELRMHFFRGQACNAYQGAIRCAAERAERTKREQDIDRLLANVERLRGRQFREQLDVAPAGSERVDLRTLRARLSDGEGILQLIDVRRELLTLLITADVARLQRIGKPRDWDHRVFELRNRLAEEQRYDRDGFDALGGELLGFAADELDDLDRLYVLTDGSLSALPPTLLPARPGRLLHESACLTLLPSLALWLEADGGETSADRARDRRALVLGDPLFAPEDVVRERLDAARLAKRGSDALGYFQRLPETADEARAIASCFPSGSSTLLIGADAVESELLARDDLESYTHLHFATHGVIGGDLPGLDEPALVLGLEDESDGFLTASEVAELELDAKLTVLSACNTGNGRYYDGEGLIGMGRAFLLAGSERVIVSLWPVESLSTQRLMEIFYRRLADGEAAERALWNAQLDLQRLPAAEVLGDRGLTISPGAGAGVARMDNPFFWSPFVMISAR